MRDEAWLPRGVNPNRREPVWRVIVLIVVAVFLAVGVGAAALQLARRPPARAALTSTSPADPATPSTVPIPTGAPSESSSTDRRTIAAGPNTIPGNLSLPHESDPSWVGSNLRIDACPHSTPEDGNIAEATDLRTIAKVSGDVTRFETLAIAADEGAASAMYDDFVTAMQNCENFDTNSPSDAPSVESPSPSSTTATVKPLKDDGRHLQTEWTRSIIMMLEFPGLDKETESSASYVLVAQAGRAVVIGAAIGVKAVDGARLDASIVRSLQAFADAMAPKVCIFKASGCAAPTVGGPGSVQFPPGSVILPDGNVMLPNGVIVDPAGRPVTPTATSTPTLTATAPPTPAAPAPPVTSGTGGFG